jgi:type I restriction enzyme R subunit
MTMPATGKPEDRARANIDLLLTAAGWLIRNRDSINIEAGRGVAIREFQLAPGHGFADYLLYIDGYAAGVIEAKKAGVPLVEVEIQSGKYSQGLPENLPAPRRPLPFCYRPPESRRASSTFSNPTPAAGQSSASTVPKRWRPGSNPISNRPPPPCEAACASCLPCPARASGTTSTASSPTWNSRLAATIPAP